MKNKNPKNKEDFWMAKMPVEMQKRMDRLLNEKIKRGQINSKDRKQNSYTRVGKAIVRHEPTWKALLEADFVEEEDYE